MKISGGRLCFSASWNWRFGRLLWQTVIPTSIGLTKTDFLELLPIIMWGPLFCSYSWRRWLYIFSKTQTYNKSKHTKVPREFRSWQHAGTTKCVPNKLEAPMSWIFTKNMEKRFEKKIGQPLGTLVSRSPYFFEPPGASRTL